MRFKFKFGLQQTLIIKYLFLIILCLTAVDGLAQHSKKTLLRPSAREYLLSEIRSRCFLSHKYGGTRRLQFYPFNKAAHIKLIAFSERNGIPVKNKIQDREKTLEEVVLTKTQVDSLTNLLYNVTYTPMHEAALSYVPGASCYEPRNGILFMDGNGKVAEYIEICFTCEHTRTSSNLINEGDYCSTKYELLRVFFASAGIKYGTAERQPVLSYQAIFKGDSTSIVGELERKLSKKTKNGKDLRGLSNTERTLFYSLNALSFCDFSGISGPTRFYFENSGNYYAETVATLKQIGANLTASAFEISRQQWPNKTVPKELSKRRTWLLSNVNKVDPKWHKLEPYLYNYYDEPGARTLTFKENLTGIILNFAYLHKHELID